MIPVTKSFIPSLDSYQKQVKRAFDNEWLTNRGALVKELEEKVSSYLGVQRESILCMSNGTIPLQVAIKALDLSGEIITTPFSYVATTSSIVWEGCKPVFVDIDPEFLTIDETKIEKAITDNTSAILATHVFGNPCNIEAIEAIAKKHNLKVIYDAAHCFGVKYQGTSIFNYGDVSTCSFHATKIFHSGEGGCSFVNDVDLRKKVYYSHNFGHKNQEDFHGLGINGKMSELHAAMGLAVFEHIDEIFSKREIAVETYKRQLIDSKVKMISIRPGTEWNYHYFPVVFSSENDLLLALNQMNADSIFPRRYFYPSLNKLPYVDNQNCVVSEDISKRILCLPLFTTITEQAISKITKYLR